MIEKDKYAEIKDLSEADRKEIFDFAVQRSREMLSGVPVMTCMFLGGPLDRTIGTVSDGAEFCRFGDYLYYNHSVVRHFGALKIKFTIFELNGPRRDAREIDHILRDYMVAAAWRVGK
jgi:hypothetical protein